MQLRPVAEVFLDTGPHHVGADVERSLEGAVSLDHDAKDEVVVVSVCLPFLHKRNGPQRDQVLIGKEDEVIAKTVT